VYAWGRARISVEPDLRHLTLPVIGTVRAHENTRRIERLIRAGRARVLAISVRRNGTRLDASVRVLIQRPQQPSITSAGSRVGVDVGVRRLATVANEHGTGLEHVPNPRPLNAALTELRHAGRPARAARKAHGATVSAPPRYPGCIAGSTMSILITCMSWQHDWLKPTAGSLLKVWMRRGWGGKRGLPVPAPDGAACRTLPWAHRAGTCPTRRAGTDHSWWSPTAGSRRREPATFVGMYRTSAGTKSGNATAVRSPTNVMTTPP